MSSASFLASNLGKYRMKKSYNTAIYIYHWQIMKPHPKMYSEPCQVSKVELFAKIVNGWKPLIIFAKKLHLRCLTGFWIRLWYLLRNILPWQWRILTQRISSNKRVVGNKCGFLISATALTLSIETQHWHSDHIMHHLLINKSLCFLYFDLVWNSSIHENIV